MNLSVKLEISFTSWEVKRIFQDQGAAAIFWDSGGFPSWAEWSEPNGLYSEPLLTIEENFEILSRRKNKGVIECAGHLGC